MTACVNKKSKRVAAVVTASLVGALSIGAPAVALAETSGIDMLAVDTEAAFKNAKITAATDNNGEALASFNDIKFVAGTGKYPVITELETGAGTKINVADKDAFKVEIVRVLSNGNEQAVDMDAFDRADVSTYRIKITGLAGSGYENCLKTVDFKLVGADLSVATVFNNTDSKNNVENTDLTYNAEVKNLGFAVDGAALELDTDYTVKFYKKGAEQVSKNEINASDLKSAGDYVVVLSGAVGSVFEGDVAQVEFTINKLDLSTAKIELVNDDEVTTVFNSDEAPKSIKIDGHVFTNYVKLSFKSADNGDKLYGAYTGYIYTVSVNDADETAAANMTGSAEVSFSKVRQKVYSNAFDFGGKFSFNLAVDDPFDVKNIKVAVPGKQGEYFTKDQLVIAVTDGNGNAASVEDLKKAGTWIVSVTVDPKANDYMYGSDAQVKTFTVINGVINTADSLYFTYKDAVVAGDLNKTYTGVDYLDSIKAVLKDGDTVLTEGVDYKVTVKKNVDGKMVEVDSIVDAGEYSVEVTSDTYELDLSTDNNGKNSIDVHVAPIDVAGIDANFATMIFGSADNFIPYTGSEIADPTFTYNKVDEDGKAVLDSDGNNVKVELPVNAYEVAYKFATDGVQFDDVEAMKEAGTYKVFLSEAKNVVNYNFNETVFHPVKVSKSKIFSDVLGTDWFAQAVYSAYDLGYIKGIGNTSLFAPETSITRADAVVVLFRMAGQDDDFANEGLEANTWTEYLTGYSDVKADAYYARAIAWATKVDIAHGSNGSFRPTDPITREEFAALLNNYAAATKNDATADDVDGALAAYPDGSAVSDWAKGAVAWAVENDVMGNGANLNAKSFIKRAEVATMAVNYQPDGVLNDSILG